jgi:hypothetical protein
MNKEEIKKQFEVAALGCLDNHQYEQFIQALEEDEELKQEFGNYQKVASLIPFSLKIQSLSPEVKNKVVIGIKKIITDRTKETKPNVEKTKEENLVNTKAENETVEEQQAGQTIKDEIYTIQQRDAQPKSNISETITQSQNVITEEDVLIESDEELVEKNEQTISLSNSTTSDENNLQVKVDYGPLLKDEIVEEVTKRVKKTIQYQFEDLENKLNKKSRATNTLLTIVIFLLLLIVAWNLFLYFNPAEKKVEIKKEIRTPLIEKPDTLP